MESTWAEDETTGIEAETSGDPAVPVSEEAHASEEAIDEVDLVLDQVEQALARLDDGSYGHCQTCGVTIEDARLAESPTVQICLNCEPALID